MVPEVMEGEGTTHRTEKRAENSLGGNHCFKKQEWRNRSRQGPETARGRPEENGTYNTKEQELQVQVITSTTNTKGSRN